MSPKPRLRYGDEVTYYPIKGGPGFQATVLGEPWKLSDMWVVNLMNLPDDYAKFVGKDVSANQTVCAASCDHIELNE